MRSTMLAAGQEVTAIPSHFETRAGKRRFLERRRRRMPGSGSGSGPGPGSGGARESAVLSASKREAEEVEG